MINLKTFLMYETQPIAQFLRNSTEYLELYSFLKDGGMPLDDIYSWINPDMRSMVERLQEKTTETIRDQLHTCEKYLFYRCHFINAGIDLVFIETETCNLWSWEDCNIYTRDSCE